MVAGGSPDWLPSGWTVQSKVLRRGRETRYFKNLETGQTCFSKDDVMQCINMQNTHRPTNTPNRRRSQKNNTQLIVKQSEYPDWLPDGWVMETKTRLSGSRIGSKYKVFIDPLIGCKFYSKPEVFSYLKSLKQKRYIPEQPKTDVKLPTGKVVVEDCTKENLPPGWKKEVRIRKIGNKIKRDPFYTDPVNGYVFRSKIEVLRYLEKGLISQFASKWKKNQISDQEMMNDKSPVRDQELMNDKSPVRDQELMNDKSPSNTDDPITSENNSSGNGSFDSANSVTPKAGESKRRQSKRLRSSNDISDTKEGTVEEFGENNETIEEPKKQKELNLPRRSSSRLAGIEPKLAMNSMFRSRDSYKGEITIALRAAPTFTDINTPVPQDTGLVQKSSKAKTKLDSSKPMKLVPRRCIRFNNGGSDADRGPDPGLAKHVSAATATNTHAELSRFNNGGNDADRGPDPGMAKHVSAATNTHAESSSSSKKACEDLNVGLEPLEKLESENNDAEKAMPCTFPSGEFWSDPCLEFAFKTLTGAIPIDTTILTSQIQRPGGSEPGPVLPDIGSPGSFQNDISDLFDGPEKTSPPKQKQPQENASVPTCSGRKVKS